MDTLSSSTIAIFIAISVIVIISKIIYIIQQQETMVIENLGKYSHFFTPGINLIIPIFQQARKIWWIRDGKMYFTQKIDLREVMIDIPEQRVITRDNAGISIDAIIYMQIVDIPRAIYSVQNLPYSVIQLTQTTLRSLIGEMDLDHTLSSREQINSRLRESLDEGSNKWGIKISRVEIKNINPPIDIQQAMEKQMQAERERRAHVLTSEGNKQSQILQAEGEKLSRISRSEGEKQEKINQADGDKNATIARAEGEALAILKIAEAQAKAIISVKEAFANEDPNVSAQYLIALEYLKKFGDITTKNTDKIFIPYEASGIISSLGGIKEILNQVSTKNLKKTG